MKFYFEGSSGWTGQVIFNPSREEFKESCPQILLWVKGSSEEQVTGALDYLVNMLASGRQCIFRARPEVNYDSNFDTKEEWWQGYMRFSFVPGNDKWSDAESIVSIPYNPPFEVVQEESE